MAFVPSMYLSKLLNVSRCNSKCVHTWEPTNDPTKCYQKCINCGFFYQSMNMTCHYFEGSSDVCKICNVYTKQDCPACPNQGCSGLDGALDTPFRSYRHKFVFHGDMGVCERCHHVCQHAANMKEYMKEKLHTIGDPPRSTRWFKIDDRDCGIVEECTMCHWERKSQSSAHYWDVKSCSEFPLQTVCNCCGDIKPCSHTWLQINPLSTDTICSGENVCKHCGVTETKTGEHTLVNLTSLLKLCTTCGWAIGKDNSVKSPREAKIDKAQKDLCALLATAFDVMKIEISK